MPSTFLLYHRDVEASTSSQNNPASAHLTPAEIALVSVFSALVFGVMIFCLNRFCPGMSWRSRRTAGSHKPSTEIKQTFLDIDDEKTLMDNYSQGPEVKQTFLYSDEDKWLSDRKSSSEKKGLGIDIHPAMRSSNGRSKRKHGSNHHESLDSTSSNAPLIKKSDNLPTSPPLTYSPRIYSPKTPPPVPGTSREVRISPQRTRPLPTPVQPKRSPSQPSRHDVSPLQTSATLPFRSELPMSFLVEIDAKREDQTGPRSRTVSPLQNPQTPIPERLTSESQLSSRNVSPISAPSTTPVITYPSATPVYLPRPFSKYNPYRPALEPATSKNWPLENMAIPEHTAVTSPVDTDPIRKHLTQSPLNPSGTTTSDSVTSNPVTTLEPEKPAVPIVVTHPELNPMFLEDFHRRRRQQQKAKEEQQKQKRKAEREKVKKQQAAAAVALLRPAKRLPSSTEKREKGIPPNRSPNQEARKEGVVRTKTVKRTDGTDRPRLVERQQSWERQRQSAHKSTAVTRNLQQEEQLQQHERQGVPPRLPSKSRKPSQSPDAYEKARRISGLHELVGSSSLGNRA